MSKIISQGAEAIIFLNKEVITKNRKEKTYRLPILDQKIRKSRTKKEAKTLSKLSNIIPVPKLIKSSEYELGLEYLEGKKLSDFLDKIKNPEKICYQIGLNVAKMHDLDIIHGDLTTSNMILKNKKVFFIDFGLSYDSNKVEDKAVDLHLIKQALEAKHFKNHELYFSHFVKGYSTSKNSKEVIKKLSQVEMRGRYKKQF